MILSSARAAAGHLFSPAFRGVFLKTVALTVVALAAIWFGVRELFEWLAMPWLQAMLPDFTAGYGWAGTFANVVASIGLALGLALLIGPASAIVAGLFLDEVAELVERTDFPSDRPGTSVPPLRSVVLSLKFFGVILAGNILALTLLFVPLVNVAAFFLVNAYLVGREFFEFAAMRFRPEEEAKAMRRRHAGTVMGAGLLIAALMAVPLLNLLTPLFACAMMVHLHKALSLRER